MLKFRIYGSVTNKIDVCTHCDEAWLDEDEAQKAYKHRFEELLGTEQYQKLSVL